MIMIVFGRSFYVNGVRHALHGSANMDTLVALSTSIAFLFSFFNTVYPRFWYEKDWSRMFIMRIRRDHSVRSVG